jgi:transcriptional regulator with XRE-family HTH domain
MDEDNWEWAHWIIEKREDRGWSQADLARKARVSRSTVSDYELLQRVHPDERTLTKIAIALGYSPETLLRVAKIIPTELVTDPLIDLITNLATQLSTEDDKNDVAEYIRLRLSMAEKRGKYETAGSKKPKKTS